MTATRRIGLLGGTFDPIHSGHLDVARAAQRELDLTAVHVLPANVPPHRPQPVASAFHRFAMAALAVAGVKAWRVSDLELRMPPPSYTAHTLRHYHARGYAPDELFFVLGADAFQEIHHWHDYPAILAAARFVVVSRPGYEPVRVSDRALFIEAPTADVSSSAIRRARAEGRSIDGMVPPAVRQHIEQHGLYTPMPPDRRPEERRAHLAADTLHGQE
ncbi:MAG TPA: nicotinate-nucleotide adenylyltransferase [Vicinamibacterales bacterium]|nr:nicotinate-nucleotide adenylyltransferase [Vicinamibacterales bacterium]